MLLGLSWVGVYCSLEVQPKSLLVSTEGSVKQDTPDSEPQSGGTISEALLTCLQVCQKHMAILSSGVTVELVTLYN